MHLAVENREDIVFEDVDKVFYFSFPRSIFQRQLFSTYKCLSRLIDEEKYSLIHCHTPVPSMITRLAARRARKQGTRILYTAHGFHFFKGAPLKNWLFYYPAEYLLSAFTDGIVTINREDYGYAKDRMMHQDTFYINGIGVDQQRFRPYNESEKNDIRSELGYDKDDFILLYIAEFIHRKNHRFIIETLPELKHLIPKLKVLFAGKGVLLEQMQNLVITLGVDDIVVFLGFRNDVPKFAGIADVGISSSRQEGLGLGLAEEMLCSVPVIATVDRGHKEMIEDGVNGFFFHQNDRQGFIKAVELLHNDSDLRAKMGQAALQKAAAFTIEKSLESMKSIYRQYLEI